MSSSRRGRLPVLSALIQASAAITGCAGRSEVELVSFKDPPFPETYTLAFDECVYRRDPSGDYRIIAHAARAAAFEGAADAQPQSSAPAPRAHGGQAGAQPQPPRPAAAAGQYLDIKLYWKPYPGRTAADPTTMDAVLRFVVVSPKGVAVYQGIGFVYVTPDKWSELLKTGIESGRLKLETISGNVPEVLGDFRMSGLLWAKPEGTRAVDLEREMNLRAGHE